MKILCLIFALCFFLSVCEAGRGRGNPNAGGPPEITIEQPDRFLIFDADHFWYNQPWNPMDPDNALQILNSHNAVRQALGLQMLSWSYQLEQSSWFWNRNCVPAHDPNLPLDVGENIVSVTTHKFKSAAFAIGGSQQWLAEIGNYLCETDSCKVGQNGREQVCGHFIQAIWDKATHVGCSIIPNCTDNSPFTEFLASQGVPKSDDDVWAQMVCRYYPPAYEGERAVPKSFCPIIAAHAANGFPAIPAIHDGKGPLGDVPGFANPEQSASTTLSAKRIIPK